MDLLQTVRKEGSRGGRSDFSWADVATSAHRENYLGHSLHAPVGRWQRGRDLSWYAKGDQKDGEDAARDEAERRKEELRKVKEAEEDEMRRALGLPPLERGEGNADLLPLGGEVGRVVREGLENGKEDRGERKTERRRKDRSRSRDRRGHGRDRSRSGEERHRRRHREGERRRLRSGERRRDDRPRRDRDREDDRERRRRSSRSRSRSQTRERHQRRRSRSPGYDRGKRRH